MHPKAWCMVCFCFVFCFCFCFVFLSYNQNDECITFCDTHCMHRSPLGPVSIGCSLMASAVVPLRRASQTMDLCYSGYNGYGHKAKQRFIVCVAHHKGTRAHATREQPMDTGPKILMKKKNKRKRKDYKYKQNMENNVSTGSKCK